MDQDCIFCKIAANTLPSWKVYESETHVAFLTPFPNTPGFAVVIPKDHESSAILTLENDKYISLLLAAKEVATRIEHSMGCKRVGLVAEGMGVDHAHVKLIPMHGIPDGPWKPILSDDPYFTDTYAGYLTTHDGPRMSDEELTRIQALIVNGNSQ